MLFRSADEEAKHDGTGYDRITFASEHERKRVEVWKEIVRGEGTAAHSVMIGAGVPYAAASKTKSDSG